MSATKFTEYGVVGISGQSPAGGDPDTIANKYLANWGLKSADGNPLNTFKGAVPGDVFESPLKLRVWNEGDDVRCALFVDTQPVPTSLDRGNVLIRSSVPGSPGHFVFDVKGNYVCKMKIKCGPVTAVPVQVRVQTPAPAVIAPSSETVPSVSENNHSDMHLNSDQAQVVGEILSVPLRMVRRMVNQPRKEFDEAALREFGENLKEQGQIQPAIVKELPGPDENGCLYELISGERRWRACGIAGIPALKIIVRKGIDSVQQFTEAVIANCHDVDLSLLETMQSVGYLHDLGKTDKEISSIFGKKSEIWAVQHRRALTLDPEVLKLLGPETPEEKQIPLTSATLLIGLPREEQIRYAYMISKTGMPASKVNYLVKGVRRNYGMVTKSRSSEEFDSVAAFFKGANVKIENFVDLSEQSLAELFNEKDPKRVKQLLNQIKDCRDNLSVVLKMFLAESQKHAEYQ